MNRAWTLVCLTLGILSPGIWAESISRADDLQLANGDTVKGHVVSVDEKHVKIKSEILGELTIERKNVRVIQLWDGTSAKPAEAKFGAPNLPTASPAPTDGGKKTSSLDDLLKDLKKEGGGGGLDVEALLKKFEAESGKSNALDELKKNAPLFGAPKVQGYVEKQIKGLADGSIKIDDIRNQAIYARDESRKVIKDLGPAAEDALGPYLSILDKFIKDTEPPAAKPTKPK